MTVEIGALFWGLLVFIAGMLVGDRLGFQNLKSKVRAVYYAAYWKPDRTTDVCPETLWAQLRDAAFIKPGQTRKILGPSRWNELEEKVVQDRK